MQPAVWLDTKRRHYAVINVKGDTKVCCFVADEWIIDDHCKVLNELIKKSKLDISQVKGWLLMNHQTKH